MRFLIYQKEANLKFMFRWKLKYVSIPGWNCDITTIDITIVFIIREYTQCIYHKMCFQDCSGRNYAHMVGRRRTSVRRDSVLTSLFLARSLFILGLFFTAPRLMAIPLRHLLYRVLPCLVWPLFPAAGRALWVPALVAQQPTSRLFLPLLKGVPWSVGESIEG